MTKPLISIIITTRNSADTLERLLESVKNQSYLKTELVVVDNNSRDNTVKIAKRYTKKVFNLGPERSAQRNFGVKKSKGKYVLILDADMELTKKVIESCVKAISGSAHKALFVPEKTVGKSLLAQVRRFEREMYMGDPTIEVARFFEREVFQEFGGYDLNLTGAEDYDLPHRISSKYTIGWAKEYILHHEEDLNLLNHLKKKYYYARKSARYADKHPDMVSKQGTILFRIAFLRNWIKFIKYPHLGVALVFLKSLETIFAVSGYIKAVGFIKFTKTLFRMTYSLW